MAELKHLLLIPVAGNTVLQWMIALAVAIVSLLVLVGLRRFVRARYRRLAATEEVELLELPLKIVSATTVLFLLIVTVFASALLVLDMPTTLRRVLASVLTISLFWQAGMWMSEAVLFWIERKRKTSLAEDKALVSSLGIIGFVVRVLIWGLVLLLTLDNLGVDITALVAGLGIGGIAVALAVQNILGDLFASLSIALDKPFIVGDFLIVGDVLGSVEYVGIKSTRLRSLSGEQIVMSNADLLSSRLRNYGRMFERRVLFTVGVTYETPREKLEQVPGLIRGLVEAQEGVRFDRCHFAKFGDFSLNFETVYYVLSPDYNRYMDVQQAINLGIFAAFERLGVEFAYPTQKLWLTPLPAANAAAGGNGG